MADVEVRHYQEQFQAFAAGHLEELREALASAADPAQRAIAAAVIGYAPRKQDVVGDLQFAMQDPDATVRANAARAMEAIAVLAAGQGQPGLRLSPTWFVEMLNSVVLMDRIAAVKALVTLTDSANPEALALIRERAVPALVEMARWKTLRYALPPFVVLGRIAGFSEREIQTDWSAGKRELVIQKALSSTRPPAKTR
jgi:hypothetical protein